MPKASSVPASLKAFLKHNKGAVLVAGNNGGDSWRPRPGDTLEGVIAQYKKEVGDNEQDLIVVDTASGPVTVWLSTVLKRQISPKDKGRKVFILFQGTAPKKKGRKYGAKLYTVALASPKE